MSNYYAMQMNWRVNLSKSKLKYINLINDLIRIEHIPCLIEEKYKLLINPIAVLLQTREYCLILVDSVQNMVEPVYYNMDSEITLDDIISEVRRVLPIINRVGSKQYLYHNQFKEVIIFPFYSDFILQGVLVTVSTRKGLLRELKSSEFLASLNCLGSLMNGIRMSARYEKLMYTDHLTNMYTEALLRKSLTKIITNKKYNEYIFVMLKVQRLKDYNLRFGYSQTNNIISYISKMLKECIAEHEQAYRFGGPYFVLLLKGDHRDAYVRINKLIETIKRLNLSELNEISSIENTEEYLVNVSAGIVDLPKLSEKELVIDTIYTYANYSVMQLDDKESGIYIYNQSKVYQEEQEQTISAPGVKQDGFSVYDILDLN